MKTLILAAFVSSMLAGSALAADYRVEMKNKGSNGSAMVFEPRLVRVEVGDTVTFIATDKGHNSASMKNGVPDGASPWKGKVNEEITVTIETPGVYMYQCTPHVGMGMIGAIVAGEPSNLESAKAVKYPGKAKKVAEEIFSEIEAGN
ncbi:Putative pseudoazurin precursor (Blue copper protein) [Pseudorhizobium banfieldiae]|uniref:Pseudoazurin n=1 Tax=Pseudorhizobium banfieldiae TaxID=1125847 RepID=L0NHJ3_9HYPH|nr:pseudoazurin [Pseudorhizobium banfieldiae]CAD6615769.1 pseudoazurin [arsenite-oxidising bacterium NT-25]CAD6618696.1 pseudoazurin [Rhizobium sp. TCK]CCF20334.1 Putative pseudoazurin precursor (Blue copper protein) [Pseudorhizobium banfieldiae]